MSNEKQNAAQKRFDELYITSSEIQKTLNVARSQILHARTRGLLPEPVVVQGARAFIWERANIQKYLDAWQITLDARRGNLTGDGATE